MYGQRNRLLTARPATWGVAHAQFFPLKDASDSALARGDAHAADDARRALQRTCFTDPAMWRDSQRSTPAA